MRFKLGDIVYRKANIMNGEAIPFIITSRYKTQSQQEYRYILYGGDVAETGEFASLEKELIRISEAKEWAISLRDNLGKAKWLKDETKVANTAQSLQRRDI